MEGEWGPTDKGSSVVVVHPLHLHIAHLGSRGCMGVKLGQGSLIKRHELVVCYRIKSRY